MIVELSTHSGRVFAGNAASIDVHTVDGRIHITSKESFLSAIQPTEITLHTAEGPCVFVLENAVAGLKGGSFTVLAERIRRVGPGETAAELPHDIQISD